MLFVKVVKDNNEQSHWKRWTRYDEDALHTGDCMTLLANVMPKILLDAA